MNLTFFGAIGHFITWTAQFATSSRTNGKTVHDADLPVNIAHEFVGYLVIFSLWKITTKSCPFKSKHIRQSKIHHAYITAFQRMWTAHRCPIWEVLGIMLAKRADQHLFVILSAFVAQCLVAFSPLVKVEVVPRMNNLAVMAHARCLLGNFCKLITQSTQRLLFLPLLCRKLFLVALLLALEACFRWHVFDSLDDTTFSAWSTNGLLAFPLPFCKVRLHALFIALSTHFGGVLLLTHLGFVLFFYSAPVLGWMPMLDGRGDSI